jgi:non-ribosomal peptide synthetase component E (peptide arylation enzyme)
MIDDYIARGYWDDVGIADILRRNAEQYPDKEALVDSEMRLTWSELNEMTERFAVGLMASGIRRDQAIVAQLPSSAILLVLLQACHKAGILCCFTPMAFRQMEMRHLFKTLKAAAVVTPYKYRNFDYFKMVREAAAEIPQLNLFIVTGNEIPPEGISFRRLTEAPFEQKYFHKISPFNPFEVSFIALSSGSTGMPKCIEHTGASCKVAGRGAALRAKLTKEDIFGIVAPLSGGPAIQSWWAALQLGAKVCLLEHFSPDDVLHLIQRERVTFLSAIPTQIIRILKETDPSKYDLSSLQVLRTGAAAFDAFLGRETEAKMRCKVVIAGGSQETYSFAQGGVDDPIEKRVQTLGRPFPGNELKIVDEKGKEVPAGEIGILLVRGAATSSGYFGDAEATLAAWGEFGKEGWFKTGDLAKLDEQGYLSLVGRKKEMILRGGQNIYPKEIEDLLHSHPNVKQAVIIGIPDPVMGERACACVKVMDGEEFVFEEMVSFLSEKGLAVHKLPERLEVLDEFPMLVDGQKINKALLIKLITENCKTDSRF